MMDVSAPTASVVLKGFENEGLLKKRQDRRYLFFRANHESHVLKSLSRIYWADKLDKFVVEMNLKFHNPTMILFGSLSKLEAKNDSDIDLAVFVNSDEKMDLNKYEKTYKREIQIFWFKDINSIKSNELKNNIVNGQVLQGRLQL